MSHRQSHYTDWQLQDRLQSSAATAPLPDRFDQDIRDLDLSVLADGRLVLLASNGRNGGISLYDMGGRLLDQAAHINPSLASGTVTVLPAEGGGAAQVLFVGAPQQGLASRALSGAGKLGAADSWAAAQLDSPMRLLTKAEEGGTLAGIDQQGRIWLWPDPENGPDTDPAAQIYTAATPFFGATALCFTDTGHLLVADAASGGVLSFRSTGGGLVAADQLGQAEGLATSAPAALSSFTAYGKSWAVLADSLSGSLSLMEVTATGELRLQDHMSDTLAVRLGAVSALETVAYGERVFLLAAGGDAGLALLELLPNGRLLHLGDHVFAPETARGPVSAMTAQIRAGQLEVFLASQAGPEAGEGPSGGIARLTLSLADMTATPGHTGTSGHDLLFRPAAGTDENPTVLSGGAGDDILLSGSGTCDLQGGAGADRFVIDAEARTVFIRDFAPGEDLLDLSALTDLRSTSGLEVRSYKYGIRLYYEDISMLVLGEGRQKLTLADLFPQGLSTPHHWDLSETWDNAIRYGGAGDDRIVGGAKRNHFDGQGGDDQLLGRRGRDTLTGGDGDDSLMGGNGHDRLWGGRDADLLKGHGQNDRLWGEAGADRLLGGKGHDRLLGGDGADLLRGGAGRDRLNGGADADTLRGEAGADVLWGGAGADRFVFASHRGRDVVRDFTPDVDLLDLSALSLRWKHLDISRHKRGSLLDLEPFGAGEIWLKGVLPDALSADDFLF